MKTKFTNLIPESLSYSIGKVYEGVYSNYPLAEMNFRQLRSTAESVREECTKEYGDLRNSLSGVSDTLRRIDYILNRIENWINESSLYNNNDAEVFLDSLSDRFDELKDMMKELDED